MIVLLTAGSMKANPVGPTIARKVAETWMQAMGIEKERKLVDMTGLTPFTEFYVFAAAEGGFIIVSGDDCAVPVIGYSLEERFPTENMPQELVNFYSGYEEEIQWCKEHPDEILDTVGRQWKLLSNGQMPKAPFDHGVMPLISTIWSQYTYYNSLCPAYDLEGNRCPVGCVAVSMAQIMKYWNYPTTGYGSHRYGNTFGIQSADFGATTYDWTHMPYRLTDANSTEEVEAVATLIRHCGVAVDMNYYSTLSGAYSMDEPFALAHFFKYRPDITILNRDNFSDSEYCALLRTELDQGRPIYVTGEYRNIGGHAFNCDGYSSRNYFHFEIDFGGNGNGYYTLSCIMCEDRVPTLTLKSAIIGIRPNLEWDSNGVTTVTASTNSASVTVTGTGSYLFGDTITLLVDSVPDGYRFNRWSDGNTDNPRTFIANGGTYHFTALLEHISRDTLSYCGNRAFLEGYAINQWGIAFPGTLFPNGDTLTAVQLFTNNSGTYTLDIHLDSMNTSPVYTESRQLVNELGNQRQWHTMPLTHPVAVDSGQDVYIVFTCNDNDYPAVSTGSYCGTPYGALLGDQLQYYFHQTWMIKGIFSPLDSIGDTIATSICDMPFYVPYDLTSDSIMFNEYAPCWTTLDADGDGYNWSTTTTSFTSNSWKDNNVLTPDNWLISPAIELPDNPCTLSWWDAVQWNYPHELYGVYISTTGTDTADFTLLAEYTHDTSNIWTFYTLSLDDWLDHTVHIAFRHFNCTNQSFLSIASIAINSYTDKTVDVYANNPAWGSVTGSGSYPHGSSVTIEASPSDGCTFLGWSNGITDNPYTLTLTSDTILTAIFDNTLSIDVPETDGVNIQVRDGRLSVDGAKGQPVCLFDINGREIINSQLSILNSQFPSGAYLLKIGNKTYKIIIP